MIKRFLLHEPDSVEAISFLLSKYESKAKVFAGGTELFLEMRQGSLKCKHLINLKTTPGLTDIEYDEERRVLKIGPLVTHRELERSRFVKEQYPLIAELERQVGNIRVRNVGTLGGNLCFAEPHTDPGTLLLAYGARVALRNTSRERELSLDQFFVRSRETALERDEILTEIKVPRLPKNTFGSYLRFRCAGLLTVGVAALVSFADGDGVKEVALAVGCVNPKPIRVPEAESLLRGRTVEEASASLEQAGDRAARVSTPVNDLRGSAEYKRHLVKVLLKRAFVEACRRREFYEDVAGKKHTENQRLH